MVDLPRGEMAGGGDGFEGGILQPCESDEVLIGEDHEEGPVDLLRLFEAPAEESPEALLLLRGQCRESREPPVRETVQDFGLPDDGRHPGEEPLGLLLQSFFAELPVEPLGRGRTDGRCRGRRSRAAPPLSGRRSQRERCIFFSRVTPR